MASNGSPILTDGSLNFQGGVDSLKPTTVATAANPNGLRRNQTAWMVNATCRDGGISPRGGWQPIYKIVDWVGDLTKTVGWQGEIMYEPLGANPYKICSIGGTIWKVDPNASGPVNLSAQFGLFNPPDIAHAYFVQGEQFVVIQAGDGVTLPLFWDGTTLRRSAGLVAPAAIPPSTFISSAVQSYTVATAGLGGFGLNSNTPVAFVAGEVSLTWPSIGTLKLGDHCEIKVAQADNNGASLGVYQVFATPVGNTLRLMWVSGGQAPHKIEPINCSLYYVTAPVGSPISFIRELPAGYAMIYHQQRIWYAYGDQRTVTAGDVVGNPSSGTKPYNYTDSILKVTENPLAIGGDGFHLPSHSGNIRALSHTTNLNTPNGQGLLLIFTRKQVYALQVPISRSDWINANSTNAPLLTVLQVTNGSVGDRCIVAVNGDLYYVSLEPAVRSLILATRYFGQPGNVQISAPENRILQFNNRELMSFSTGIEFDNRLLMSALPKQLSQGVVHQAILPLDFMPVSSPGSEEPPTWQGHWEGLDILQLTTGDFGGLQRAFATVVSEVDGSIWLWELSQASLTDNGDNRITMQIEFPAFNWGDDFSLDKLQGGELWIDRLSGTVEFTLEYRNDGNSCWIKWLQWKECSARDCEENVPPNCSLPPQYPVPLTPQGLGYRQTIGFPKPPVVCDKQMGRPSDTAHQIQCRLTVKGSCRVRGFFLHASKVERQLYANLPC